MSKEGARSMIKKQSGFSRSLHNEGKMGAYYTDTEHCELLGELFDFPEEEVCVLEPSIGNAEAAKRCTKKVERGAKVKIFGVELNEETFNGLKHDKEVDHVICGDFTTGIKISHDSFSFCFANPPYMKNHEGRRVESVFLHKLTPYLKKGAVLVYIVPTQLFRDDRSFTSYLSKRFDVKHVFRFQDKEFQKYNQLAIIAVKKEESEHIIADVESLDSLVFEPDKIPILNKENISGVAKIQVKPSSSSTIKYFQSEYFDFNLASEITKSSPLFTSVFKKAFDYSRLASTELENPIIQLKPDHMYLLGVGGNTFGLVGDPDKGDCHLQRGKTKEKTEVEHEAKEHRTKVIERTYAQACVTIIEDNGNIRELQ